MYGNKMSDGDLAENISTIPHRRHPHKQDRQQQSNNKYRKWKRFNMSAAKNAQHLCLYVAPFGKSTLAISRSAALLRQPFAGKVDRAQKQTAD